MTHRKVPRSHFVYEYSYPVDMPELAGIVFYVGKATNAVRLDAHLTEATSGCECIKCQAIRSIWDLELVVVRRIVFESRDEAEALVVEKHRIEMHISAHLTNFRHNTNRGRLVVNARVATSIRNLDQAQAKKVREPRENKPVDPNLCAIFHLARAFVGNEPDEGFSLEEELENLDTFMREQVVILV